MPLRSLPTRYRPPVLGSFVAFLIWAFLAGCITDKPAVSAKAGAPAKAAPTEDVALAAFQKVVSPILQERCYECHGDGAKKAGIAFDELTTKEHILRNPELWVKVLRNTRSHVMPPPEEPGLSSEEQLALEQWIKTGGFGLDPTKPDPGRVTVRRLNRTEYRNTLRDLIGVDFDADAALPPDDVGYGFDNIGDVLNISPMRMEKFIEAAISAVNQGVPLDTVVLTTRFTDGLDYLSESGAEQGIYGKNAAKMSYYVPQKARHRYKIEKEGDYRITLNTKIDGESAPIDPQRAHVKWTSDGKILLEKEYPWNDADYLQNEFLVHWQPGEHDLNVEIEPVDPALQPLRTKMEYRVLFVNVDGPLDKKQWDHHPNYKRFYTRDLPPENPAERRVYAREVLTRFASKAYRRPATPDVVEQLVDLAEKSYSVPGNTFEKGISQAIIAVLASPRFLFHVENTKPVAKGQSVAELDEYALAARLSYAMWSSLPDDELTQLAARGELRKNFRAQVQRMLVDPKAKAFADNFSGQWLQSRGVLDVAINSAVVMEAEGPPAPPPAATPVPPAVTPVPAATTPVAATAPPAAATPPYTLANADPKQVERLLKGIVPSNESVTSIPPALPDAALAGAQAGVAPAIPAPTDGNLAAAAPGGGRGRGRGAGLGGAPGAFAGGRGGGRGGRGPQIPLGTSLTPEIRTAMKQETEAYFNYIVREDRSVLELLNSNYTFVNDQLAAVYGLPNITGSHMRRVELPADSVRGGVLTMGSILTVTSNPTRTSPVKRGKWILENLLGAPPPPPPPNVPALEESKAELKAPTQRELLALHRADPKCASCHSRMDPPGLAMENFNAFGRVRTQEFGRPIEPAGELATGEKFNGVRDLKQVLVEKHRVEFYRTITEKLMTYILGRGVEYYDTPTVDSIVERLDQDNGRFSTLLLGVLESVPFQQRRTDTTSTAQSPDNKSVVLNAQPTSSL